MDQWLSTLFHANCSPAQVYVLTPSQFIFALSCRRRSVLQVCLSSESQEGYFETFFVYLMMTNVMVKACVIFNQEIIKIWIWSGKKLRITHVRDRNLTEGRIYPKAEFDRIPNVPKIRSVDWTHDMIIVKWHLLILHIWRKRKLCARTNRPPAPSTRTGQWLSTLFHANCSPAQVYVLTSWQFIFALSCRRRLVLHVCLSSESQEGYFKTFLRMWWWQMLRWKHVLIKK